MRSAGLVLLTLVALSGCALRRSTAEITIDSDIQRTRTFTVRVAALTASEATPVWHAVGTFAPSHADALPASFTVLAPTTGELQTTLLLDVSILGGPSFRRSSRITFVQGAAVDVRFFLSDRCATTSTGCLSPGICTIAVACEERGLTCGDTGACVAREVVATPRGDAGQSDADASTATDATVADTFVPECIAGQTRCAGAELQQCAGGRFVGMATCATAGLCAATGCRAPACNGGQLRCDGRERERCNGERTGWDRVERCATDALCAPSGCHAPACAAGEGRCVGVNREQCNDDRTGWVVTQTCASAALCTPAGCNPPACAPGQLRCDGRNRQSCRGDRTGWDTIQVCDCCNCICTPNACEDACA